MLKKVISFLLMFILLQFIFDPKNTKAHLFKHKISSKETQLTKGLTHIEEKYRTNNKLTSINLLTINLNDAHTALSLGIPEPINELSTVKSLASKLNSSSHQIVAAINAAFFQNSTYPANLITINNQIINYGKIGENRESPTQQPVAFGINESGEARIDYFDAKIIFEVNNKRLLIDRINQPEENNKTIIYTEDNLAINRIKHVMKIFVETTKPTKNINFGETYTGKIKMINPSVNNNYFPVYGFIVSIQNKQLAKELNYLKAGDKASLTLSIDKKWQNAKYILAAGPLLVKNNQEAISMPKNTSFVLSNHARTVVGVNHSGNPILVTIDGKKKGHSHGTNLIDLAHLLVSKGIQSAINLDGGGSTTMIINQQGSLKLANIPIYGYEREVSAILQAVHIPFK